MLNNSKPRLFILGVLLSVFTLGVSSCGDDDDNDLIPNTPSNPPPTDTTIIPIDTASYLDLMSSHLWTLYETHQNGVLSSTGGTDLYEYTYGGAFLWESAQGWVQIGNYTFSADSSSINTRFSGTSTPILMKLEVLSEDSLHTRFTTNGNEFLYIYHK